MEKLDGKKFTRISITNEEHARSIAIQVGLLKTPSELSEVDLDRFAIFWNRVEQEIILKEQRESFNHGMVAEIQTMAERRKHEQHWKASFVNATFVLAILAILMNVMSVTFGMLK